jgi:hypothetical protein
MNEPHRFAEPYLRPTSEQCSDVLRPGASLECEGAALAAIYRRAIERYEEAKAVDMTSTDGDDAKKGSLKHEVRAETSLPR